MPKKIIKKYVPEKYAERSWKVDELKTLYNLAGDISYTLNYQDLFKTIMEALFDLVDYDIAATIVFDDYSGVCTINPVYDECYKFSDIIKKRITKSVSILSGRSVNKSVIIRTSVIKADKKAPVRDFKKIRSSFSVPFVVKGKITGMINVSSCRKNAFNEDMFHLIYTITNSSSKSIERLKDLISAERLRMERMVESMTEGVIMIDDSERVAVFNPMARKMLGFGADELIFKNTLYKRIANGFLEESITEARKERVVKEINFVNEKGNRVLRFEVLSIGLERDNSTDILIVIRDITEAKEIDEMKSDFVATVSHELKTPLSIMREGVDIILSGLAGEISQKQSELLSVSKDSIDRLTNIISDLLDISKIEAGKIIVERDFVNLTKVIREAADSFKSRALERNIKVILELPRKPIEAYLDRDKMILVFTNLFSNAIKFTKNGTIIVKGAVRPESIKCEVIDSGIGIARENLPKVFGKFQQFDREFGPGEKGTGLGLSIVKGIVDLHKGEINVLSDLGKGTRFNITLPRLTAMDVLLEQITSRITGTAIHDYRLSLISISLTYIYGQGQVSSGKKVMAMLNDLKTIVNNNLRSSKDFVIVVGDRIYVLVDGGVKVAKEVHDRCNGSVEKYLFDKDIINKVKFRLNYVVYPDDTNIPSELVNKVHL